ncbi:AEC family transporter [Hoyosella sp. G463]|uniref:AEC family transporter n=1 Tax=Lolliginicoccus lacisalsi TaxID=2742202 RepID=A0A927JBL4_9ACTN|nr:AEC family transporter [Lolliginicoccus lacisalsi]MBD8506086.1 AEC family transporter [Lolliginicoccus lacisalsi]
MSGVVVGFSVILGIIGVGYLLGRTGALGTSGEQVLARLVFLVATPAMLFHTLAHADVSVVFSPGLVVAAGSASLAALVYFVLARAWLRRRVAESIIGALAASYVNSVNLGLPIAVYVLGDATVIAPLLLFQVVFLGPIALGILEITLRQPHHQRSLAGIFMAPLRNPILIGAALGMLVALSGISVPEIIDQPIELIGGMAVPGALIAFGISLHGTRALRRGTSPRRDVLLASTIKVLAQPLLAWLIGAWMLGLEGESRLVVVVRAALPTAQNVFVFASWYGRGVVLARDSAIVTTVLSVPVIAACVLLA